MLSNAFYSGLFETIRHDLRREEAIAYALWLRRFFRMGWADLLGMERVDAFFFRMPVRLI